MMWIDGDVASQKPAPHAKSSSFFWLPAIIMRMATSRPYSYRDKWEILSYDQDGRISAIRVIKDATHDEVEAITTGRSAPEPRRPAR